jgi:hypothetical protein
MTRTLLALALCAGLLAGSPRPARAQSAPVEMPAGTPVTLALLQEVKSGRVREGDVIHFRVDEDVIAPDGAILIRRGTPAYGRVTRSRKAGLFGKKGALGIEIEYTLAVDRQRVELNGDLGEGHKKKSGTLSRVGEVTKSVGRAGIGLVTSVVAAPLAPLGLLAGGGLRGKDVTLREGTRLLALVERPLLVAALPVPVAPTPPSAAPAPPAPPAPPATAPTVQTVTLRTGEVLVGTV